MIKRLAPICLLLGLATPASAFDLTSLISLWKLDEASGNAVDSVGSNTLTDTSTVGAATGKVAGARDFEVSTVEYFTITDNASLSTGDIDFTFACWVQLESNSGNMHIIGKWTTAADFEYRLFFDQAANRFSYTVSSDGINTSAIVNASNFGAPSTGVWYFIVFWHDSASNVIGIQVNDGTANTTSHTTGVFNSAAVFDIGARQAGTAPWDGLIDEVVFFKRILTTDEKTALYNGGNGLAYPWATDTFVPRVIISRVDPPRGPRVPSLLNPRRWLATEHALGIAP